MSLFLEEADMKNHDNINILLTFVISLLCVNSAFADGGMRKSKNPAGNIYGVQKNAIEDSFGNQGKSIDRGDFGSTKKGSVKKEKKVKPEPSKVPTFDDLSVPSASNPIILPPSAESTERELKKGKWQEF